MMKKNTMKAALLLLGGCGMAVLLLWQYRAAAEGAKAGLAACGNVLIPALFPFLALSVIIGGSSAGKILSAPVGVLGKLLYGAPKRLGAAILLSWIGGYPAGAKVLAEQLEHGDITPQDAEKALCFCVNSGPAFMTGVVGGAVFGSATVGLGIFGCQLVAGVLTARLMLWKTPFATELPHLPKHMEEPFASLLVRAVTGASASMIAMCAFVVFFTTLTAILQACGVLGAAAGVLSTITGGILTVEGAKCLLAGLLEICGGSAAAVSLLPRQAALVLPFLLSFSSLSVICQVSACFPAGCVPLGRFFRSRLLHGLLTQALALPWLWPLTDTTQTFASGNNVFYGDASTAVGTLCLLGMCSILFLTLEYGASGGRHRPG